MDAFAQTLADQGVRHAFGLTARVAVLALALQGLAGIGLGYALSRHGWPGRGMVDALVTLPLVFPPVATGFFLLWLLGRQGPFGAPLRNALGIELVFSYWGVLVAAFVSGLPLVVKPMQAALESVGSRYGEAARTLGKTEFQILVHVLLPNTRRALAGGLLLGFGRSLGEVGITLMLGGNVIGRTATVSLEIYNAVTGGEFERAAVLSTLLGAATLVAFALLRRIGATPVSS